jgi:hypothetical protein
MPHSSAALVHEALQQQQQQQHYHHHQTQGEAHHSGSNCHHQNLHASSHGYNNNNNIGCEAAVDASIAPPAPLVPRLVSDANTKLRVAIAAIDASTLNYRACSRRNSMSHSQPSGSAGSSSVGKEYNPKELLLMAAGATDLAAKHGDESILHAFRTLAMLVLGVLVVVAVVAGALIFLRVPQRLAHALPMQQQRTEPHGGGDAELPDKASDRLFAAAPRAQRAAIAELLPREDVGRIRFTRRLTSAELWSRLSPAGGDAGGDGDGESSTRKLQRSKALMRRYDWMYPPSSNEGISLLSSMHTFDYSLCCDVSFADGAERRASTASAAPLSKLFCTDSAEYTGRSGSSALTRALASARSAKPDGYVTQGLRCMIVGNRLMIQMDNGRLMNAMCSAPGSDDTCARFQTDRALSFSKLLKNPWRLDLDCDFAWVVERSLDPADDDTDALGDGRDVI